LGRDLGAVVQRFLEPSAQYLLATKRPMKLSEDTGHHFAAVQNLASHGLKYWYSSDLCILTRVYRGERASRCKKAGVF